MIAADRRCARSSPSTAARRSVTRGRFSSPFRAPPTRVEAPSRSSASRWQRRSQASRCRSDGCTARARRGLDLSGFGIHEAERIATWRRRRDNEARRPRVGQTSRSRNADSRQDMRSGRGRSDRLALRPELSPRARARVCRCPGACTDARATAASLRHTDASPTVARPSPPDANRLRSPRRRRDRSHRRSRRIRHDRVQCGCGTAVRARCHGRVGGGPPATGINARSRRT